MLSFLKVIAHPRLKYQTFLRPGGKGKTVKQLAENIYFGENREQNLKTLHEIWNQYEEKVALQDSAAGHKNNTSVSADHGKRSLASPKPIHTAAALAEKMAARSPLQTGNKNRLLCTMTTLEVGPFIEPRRKNKERSPSPRHTKLHDYDNVENFRFPAKLPVQRQSGEAPILASSQHSPHDGSCAQKEGSAHDSVAEHGKSAGKLSSSMQGRTSPKCFEKLPLLIDKAQIRLLQAPKNPRSRSVSPVKLLPHHQATLQTKMISQNPMVRRTHKDIIPESAVKNSKVNFELKKLEPTSNITNGFSEDGSAKPANTGKFQGLRVPIVIAEMSLRANSQSPRNSPMTSGKQKKVAARISP